MSSPAAMEQQCIFCSIIQGKIPSKKVYEDDLVFAILDIYPANPAHVLVLPKEHALIFNQLPKKTAEHMGIVAKKITEVLFKVIQPDGVNVFIANGPAAGQKAPHFIMHVIPRFQGDGLSFTLQEKSTKHEEMDSFYDKLKKMLLDYFPDQKYDEKEKQEEQKRQNKMSEEKQERTQEREEKTKTEETKSEQKKAEPSEQKKDEPKKVRAEPMDIDKLTDLFG